MLKYHKLTLKLLDLIGDRLGMDQYDVRDEAKLTEQEFDYINELVERVNDDIPLTTADLLEDAIPNKVRLFVREDMVCIDIGKDPADNFGSTDYDTIIANVTSIECDDGIYTIHTDYKNPHRVSTATFMLSASNFAKIRWLEE